MLNHFWAVLVTILLGIGLGHKDDSKSLGCLYLSIALLPLAFIRGVSHLLIITIELITFIAFMISYDAVISKKKDPHRRKERHLTLISLGLLLGALVTYAVSHFELGKKITTASSNFKVNSTEEYIVLLTALIFFFLIKSSPTKKALK